MPSKPACIAVLIHGLGDQKETWSRSFRRSLNAELARDAARVQLVDAYWAPLSTIRDAVHPTMAAAGRGLGGTSLEDEVYGRTVSEFSRMLADEAGARGRVRGFGPGDILDWLKDKLEAAPELVADVSNYVARNGVRTAVQNVLHARLAEAHSLQDRSIPVVLVSHSQGTVISYDVLRQAGPNYVNLRTWITMGSPLRKYFAFPLQWGRQQLGVPSGLRWVNLYDKKDIAGKDLRSAVDWRQPRPIDVVVDNKKNAANAHDHWHNPEVVKAVAGEIRRVLA